MPENYSKKRVAIIRETKKAIKNYSVVKEEISKERGDLDTIEGTIDENIDKLDKATKLFEVLPEEQVTNPSPVLGSFIASASELAESAYAHSEYFREGFQRISDETDLLIGTTTVADSSGNTIMNVSSFAAKTAALNYPEIEDLTRELILPSRYEKKEELEHELRKIDERLANMFVGAWQTLRDTSKRDRYRQASSSMRELLSHFLDHLAPPKEVKKADWYKPELNEETNKIRKKPTQRSRAKYAIMGERSKETLDEEDLKMITVLMDDARKAYKDLSKLAHARKEEIFNLAESHMERCEEVIRTILVLKKRFLNR